MSISAPEAHQHHLPENVIRGTDDYADVQSHQDSASEGAEQRVAADQPRGAELGRTAVVASITDELIDHPDGQDAAAESRRTAILLASAALERRRARRQTSIARRYM